MGPKDPILGVSEAFKADPSPDKMNLGVGAYRDDNGNPVVLPSIKEAQNRINDSNLDNEYAPIVGVQRFNQLACELAYGPDSEALKNDTVCKLQALSGTGSLRLLAAFIKHQWKGDLPTCYMSNPTWGNHFPIFQHAGLTTSTYTYYDPKTIGFDKNGMLADIMAAPDNSVFILHASAHNPTGIDPTMEQWKEISDAMKKKNHFVAFDMAYQGFASGDCEKDVASVRHFIEDGHKVCLLQSFAKNFGLYGHRVGTFSIMCNDAEEKARVESQVKILARAIWSNPPVHGARIVQTVLDDPVLKPQWLSEVKGMADRIMSMRDMLKAGLEAEGSTRNWNHVIDQIGMFCYSGMTPEMVDTLAKDHHVYMTRNGRISMAGVTSKNVGPLAKAMHAVTK
jgi:aspartate aminotransferase